MVDSNPPPNKSTGSSGFVLAAGLMLLVMAGLLIWKWSHGQPVPSERNSMPVLISQRARVLEEPPPPPPPMDEVSIDSGVTRKREQPAAVRPASGGCSDPCTGEASQSLASELRSKAMQAQVCYERALRQDPTLQGQLSLGVRIGPRGQVCSANVVADSLADATVTSCALQIFRASTFRPPRGGCINARVPMRFVPKP
jgi:hypothetical protein